MRFGSVCSGVEAASVAWEPLGWKAQWFSEIEKFPSQVLNHHYPDVPNYGDMTKFKEWNADTIDLLVGGTPCQSFSIAGLRKGLEDPRGNLMLTYLAMAEQLKPKWLVWENVTGVLSSNGGKDFGTFLSALGQIGYGFSWRILDAQYFGVPQRRRRLFVVGYLGNWKRAAEVLFESESVSGHPAPSRETGQKAAGYTTTSFGRYSEGVGTIRAAGGDLGGGSETLHVSQPIAFGAQNSANQGDSVSTEVTPTLDKSKTPAVLISDPARTLLASGSDASPCYDRGPNFVAQSNAVRRLTPTECERLQGFPDGYTQIPWRNKPAEDCPVGPRYKAMGNSMAVPVMRWIGERIQKQDNQ